MSTKSSQLQIRVSPKQKATIKRAAKASGLDMSEYILLKVIPPKREKALHLIKSLKSNSKASLILASFHDLIINCSAEEFVDTFSNFDLDGLEPYLQNYIAALIELGAKQKKILPPEFVKKVPRLREPYFASQLQSLRLHLLTSSPLPFRKRNLFIDSSLGDRV